MEVTRHFKGLERLDLVGRRGGRTPEEQPMMTPLYPVGEDLGIVLRGATRCLVLGFGVGGKSGGVQYIHSVVGWRLCVCVGVGIREFTLLEVSLLIGASFSMLDHRSVPEN